MNKFYFVAPQHNTTEEIIECAVKLIEHNYEQLPNENLKHNHLFINTEDMTFFFTDQHGLDLLLETAPAAFDTTEIFATNLQQINEWEQRKPRPRIKA